MKLMYAVWTTEPAALLSPALRDELRGAGASRLQVNLDDEDVRQAQLRISTFPERIRAVVSVWTGAAPASATSALSRLSTRMLGWVVEEASPIPPPRTEDGRRANALANVALLRIPDGMSPELWRERWQGRHTQVAIETQATFGYVQNRVIEALTPEDDPVAALVEELFPIEAMTDWHAFYGSGGSDEELRGRMRRMADSTSGFGASTNLDLVPTSRYVYRLRH